jgi:transcriptional regulator with XRE-family HTH domain
LRSFQRSSFGARLRGLRLAKGLSQVDLARLVGRHQTVVGPYERDEYEPPRDIVEKLARVLETSPEYLYFGRSPLRSTIALAGRLGPLGLLEGQPDQGGEGVSGGAQLTMKDDQLLGFRVGDDSMAPAFRPGQVALAGAQETTALADLLGRDVLAELADGRVLLRRLLPGADPGRHDLAAYNAPTLAGAAVRAARPVLGALWPDAWVGAPDEGRPQGQTSHG